MNLIIYITLLINAPMSTTQDPHLLQYLFLKKNGLALMGAITLADILQFLLHLF